MGFRSKLYLAFGTVLALMALVLGLAMFTIYRLNDNLGEVIRDRYEKARMASAIEQQLYFTDGALKNIILVTDSDRIQTALDEISAAQTEQRNAYEAYGRMAHDPQVQEILPKLKNTLDSFDRLTQDIINLVNAGRQQDATRLLMSDGHRIMGQAMAFTKELKANQERIMLDILENSAASSNLAAAMVTFCIIAGVIIGLGIAGRVIDSVSHDLRELAKVIGCVRDANAGALPRVSVVSQDEIGHIALAFNEMAAALEHHRKQEKDFVTLMETESWIKSQLAELSTLLQSVNDQPVLGRTFISMIAPAVRASYAVFYLVNQQAGLLTKLASYADTGDNPGTGSLRLGQGITGQCAIQNQAVLIEQVPAGYIKIASGLGCAQPDYLAVFPVAFENNVLAVVEVAGFGQLSDRHHHYLQQAIKDVALALVRVSGQMQVEQLLADSQAFAEELQSQSEEMQQQQEELRVINDRLEEQYKSSEQKTHELEQAKTILEEQTRQLDLAAGYKSEFLANMSHELRTPLNSLLILAQMLEANPEKNLTAKQLAYARAIHSAGGDLLLLINDILDLSKLESGKLCINPEEVSITSVAEELTAQFMPVAERSELKFKIDIDRDVPPVIYTDEFRLLQILKNLLSNAFKFTEKGWVNFCIRKAANPQWLVFEVSDTGIGIPVDKQALIFEAFHQADGTTSRKYGGTGLGLSISRELSRLLGGSINLESREGYGSTFTLYLPVQGNSPAPAAEELRIVSAGSLPPANRQAAAAPPPPSALPLNGAESATVLAGEKILVVDDDMRNVYALVAAMEAKGMTALFAQNGREGLACLQTNPDIALVIMDIMMPEMDGYEAIRQIRKLPAFYNLPVIALTAKAMKQDREKCLAAGASDYISKPVQLDQLFSLLKVWLQK